ncbi:Uncharacterized protein Rs2_41058 [Raphanus sativus]|nr:Uncharacterized protein Rs2_41058 [Raphanus sativus]
MDVLSWTNTHPDELSKLVRSSELVRPPNHMRSNRDICSLFEAYLLNHDVSSRETTWRMCSTQLWNSSKKIQIKRSSYERVIPCTNQVMFSSREFSHVRIQDGFRPGLNGTCLGPFQEYILHFSKSRSWLHQETVKVSVKDFI